MEKRAEELLNRAVVALESLAEEPQLEIPTSPPICPHCGTINPNVRGHETEGEGPMSEIFLELQCTTCENSFYVVPEGWVNFTEEVELKEFFERAGNGNSSEPH